MGEAVKREETSVLSGSPTPTAHASTHTSLTRAVSLAATDSATGIEQPSATETIPFNTPSPTGFLSPPTLTPDLSTASPISTPPTQPVDQLETGVKIGISVLGGFLGLVLIVFLLETCYLRRRRQEKAFQRAVDEVERGERAEQALASLKGSEEIVVLESRVSIVFDDVSEDEYEEELERGRARNGMSLARRDC
jgi:hypothetical protein